MPSPRRPIVALCAPALLLALAAPAQAGWEGAQSKELSIDSDEPITLVLSLLYEGKGRIGIRRTLPAGGTTPIMELRPYNTDNGAAFIYDYNKDRSGRSRVTLNAKETVTILVQKAAGCPILKAGFLLQSQGEKNIGDFTFRVASAPADSEIYAAPVKRDCELWTGMLRDTLYMFYRSFQTAGSGGDSGPGTSGGSAGDSKACDNNSSRPAGWDRAAAPRRAALAARLPLRGHVSNQTEETWRVNLKAEAFEVLTSHPEGPSMETEGDAPACLIRPGEIIGVQVAEKHLPADGQVAEVTDLKGTMRVGLALRRGPGSPGGRFCITQYQDASGKERRNAQGEVRPKPSDRILGLAQEVAIMPELGPGGAAAPFKPAAGGPRAQGGAAAAPGKPGAAKPSKGVPAAGKPRS